MGKKIIIITGSPRKQGNTNTIVNWVVEGAGETGAEIKIIDAARLNYKTNGCTACMGCQESEEYRCIIQDEASDLIASIPEYDTLVLASPVYFFSYSAQMKLFMDRMYSLTKFREDGIVSKLKDINIALIATSAGDIGSGMDLLDMNIKKLAGFFGNEAKSFLAPLCSFEASETLMDAELKEHARKFGVELAQW